MALTGLKINELDNASVVTNETVLPVVYVNNGSASDTATKATLEQVKELVQEDNYTKTETDTLLNKKQDKLTAGDNITITEDSDDVIISSTAQGGSSYTAGTGIEIESDEISIDDTVLTKTKLVAGSNVTITEDSDDNLVISSTGGSSLPSQTGQSGKFLTTDGTNASWAQVSVPEGVYTKTNLLAASPIEIVDEMAPEGLDEHTLGCWHFENNIDNAVADSTLTDNMGSVNKGFVTTAKFGTYAVWLQTSSLRIYNSTALSSYTIDFWLNKPYSSVYYLAPGADFYLGLWGDGSAHVKKYGAPDSDYVTMADVATGWHHYAFVRDGVNCYCFFDGVLKHTFTASVSATTTMWQDGAGGTTSDYIDELRISDVARWISNFTPATHAYGTLTPTGNSVISFDQSIIPTNIWTQDNLVAGDNVTITKKIDSSVITEDTIGVWHFDNSSTDVVNNLYLYNYPENGTGLRFNTTYTKFDSTASAWYLLDSRQYTGAYFNNWLGADIRNFTLASNTDTTIDFWYKPPTSTSATSSNKAVIVALMYRNVPTYLSHGIYIAPSDDNTTISFGLANNFSESTLGSTFIDNVPVTSDFHHIAFELDGAAGSTKVTVYVDGIEKGSTTIQNSEDFVYQQFNIYTTDISMVAPSWIDELRLSKGLVYNGNFADNLPTRPYSTEVLPDVYQINSTGGTLEPIVTDGIVPSTVSTQITTTTPTASSNGWYNIVGTSSGTSSYITSEITSTNSNYQVVAGYPSGEKMSLLVPAKEGSSYNFGSGSVYDLSINFIPAESSKRSLVPTDIALNITVQASGSTYVAAETGWMAFSGTSQGDTSVITSEVTADNHIEMTVANHPNGYAMAINFPVVKGRTYKISYTGISSPACKLIVGAEVEVAGGGGTGADTSLSNITNDGKQVITEMAAPSSVYEVLTPVNNATYTAPADGWFYLYGITTGDNNDAYLYNGGSGIDRMNSIRVSATTVYSANKIIGISYPAKVGEVVGLEYTGITFTDGSYNNIGLRFYYLEGNKSEYTPS